MPEDQVGSRRTLRFPGGRFEDSIVSGIRAVQGLLAIMAGLMVVFWLLAAGGYGEESFYWLLVGVGFAGLAYAMKYLYTTVEADDE